MRYILLLTSMLFAVNATITMENNNKSLSNSFLTHKLFLITNISDKFQTPKDITKIIQWLYAMPKHLQQWNDFNIPLNFNLKLSEQNLKTIEAFFDSPTSHIANFRGPQITYYLTPELYTDFIALPKEFREYLTNLPQSKQTLKKPTLPINSDKIVMVNGKRLPIIPENNRDASLNTYTSRASSLKSLMLENMRLNM